MRLIDADALIQKRNHAKAYAPDMYVIGQGYVMDAPTISAAPVARGDVLDKKDAEISKLSQDVEHLRALLDRAVEEIKRFGSCQACGHNAPSEKYPVLGECEFGGCNGGGRGSIEEDRWQWRGFSEREG